MILSGCQGKPRVELITRKCPGCGAEVELVTTDTEVICEKCGHKIFNDTLSCVKWCEHARECMGDEMYEYLLKKYSEDEDSIDLGDMIAEAGEIGRTY